MSRNGQRGYLIVICCELACSFNGIEIELADFGVGIVEIQGVFWSDNNVLFFRHQLKAGYYFHDFSCESHTEPSPMEGKNGLKIVCDSGAGFSTEQAVFLANNLAKKMRSLKQKCNLRQYSYSMTVQSCIQCK